MTMEDKQRQFENVNLNIRKGGGGPKLLVWMAFKVSWNKKILTEKDRDNWKLKIL